MRPAEALSKQSSLGMALTQPGFRKWIHSFISKFDEDDLVQLPNKPDQQKFSDEINSWIDTLTTGIAALPTYYVSPEMVDVTRQAADLLDHEVDFFDAALAPTSDGIVILDGPGFVIKAADTLQGRFLVPVRAIIWCPATVNFGDLRVAGKAIWYFGELSNEAAALFGTPEMPDYNAAEHADLLEKYKKNIHPNWVFYKFEIKLTARSLPAHLKDDEIQAVPGERPEHLTNRGRARLNGETSFVHALWTLLNQTITVTERDIPDRATLKRCRRYGLPEFVTVIRLRHKVYPPALDNEGNPASVEWQRRWLVRGHWMWARATPSTPGAVELSPDRWRVRVWRGQHIKGPEDKPLVLTRKVNALLE